MRGITKFGFCFIASKLIKKYIFVFLKNFNRDKNESKSKDKSSFVGLVLCFCT